MSLWYANLIFSFISKSVCHLVDLLWVLRNPHSNSSNVCIHISTSSEYSCFSPLIFTSICCQYLMYRNKTDF